jgi:hypothetical protein
LEVLQGELRIYVKSADNGARRRRAFCPECGTPIYSAHDDSESTFFGLRAGANAQHNQLVPGSQYWCRSAQAWVRVPKTDPVTLQSGRRARH